MAVQDESDGVRSNTSASAGNCNSNGGSRSEMVIQQRDMGSFATDHTPKVRKPYTITKQREKWTNEEHQKFLEALKLYGRGWRQIEEYVGTKTAVQIRSHAQKFFSKVERESSCNTESTIKPIEIPPPRPKRKPLHPYPRKSAEFFKGQSVSNEPERSPSPNLLVAEKDSQSPTSVISAGLGSDAFEHVFSEQTNRCTSPNSYTTDMPSISLSQTEKENGYLTSSSAEEEEKGSLSSVGSGLTEDNLLSLKFESCSKEIEFSESDSGTVPPCMSIKIFGRTVSIADKEKSLAVGEDNIKLERCASNQKIHVGDQKLDEKMPSDKQDTELSLGVYDNSVSSSSCGTEVPSMENQKEKLPSMDPVHDSPLHFCPLYQAPIVFYLGSNCQISIPRPIRPSVNERIAKDIPKESPNTGFNAGSVSEGGKEKNLDAVDSQSQGVYHKRIVTQKTSSGFVPYKRCLAEREAMANKMIGTLEERQQQRARVCS